MAQKIQLDLLLNARGADTTLAELRKQVQAANQELENTKIGTTRYAQLKAAVASANTELAAQDKLIKGITSEEMAGAYARIGGGISSTFTAASAALNMFGVENEGVMKAAADAQNLLTLAISTRQIQEGLLSAKMLANISADKIRLAITKLTTKATNQETVAEVGNTAAQEANTKSKVKNAAATGADAAAQGVDTAATITATGAKGLLTAATTALTTAFRAFYATLLANPLIAFIALIGLLVYAVIELADTLSKTEQEQKAFRDELIKQQSELRATEIQTLRLRNVVMTQANSEKIRLAAYKELQKTLPGLNDLTMKQAIETGKLNEALRLNTKLARDKIYFDAAAARFGEKLVTLRTLQGDREAGLNVSQKELNKATQEYNSALRVLNDATGKYNNSLLQQNVFIGDNTRGKKANSAANSQQIAENERIRLQLDDVSKYLKEQIDLYKGLAKVRETEDYIPAILKRAQEVTQARQKAIQKSESEAFESLKRLGVISENAVEQTSKNTEITAKSASERLAKIFKIRYESEQKFIQDNTDYYGREITARQEEIIDLAAVGQQVLSDQTQTLRETFTGFFQKGDISEKALESLDVLISNIQQYNNAVTQSPSVSEIFDSETIKRYNEALQNRLILEGKLNFVGVSEEEARKRIIQAQKTQLQDTRLIAQVEEKVRKQTIAGLQKEIGKRNENALAVVNLAEQRNQLNKQQADALRKDLGDESKRAEAIQNLIEQVAEARIQAIQNTAQGAALELGKITTVFTAQLAEVQKAAKLLPEALTSEIERLSESYVNLSRESADAIEIVSGVLGINFSNILSKEEKLAKANEFILQSGLEKVEFTEEQKLRIYDATFSAQEERAREGTEDLAKQIEKFIQIAQQAFNAYQEYIQRAEELATEKIIAEEKDKLRQLEDAYQQGLVLERTYQKKRTELTEEYAAQRAAIEKKYRIKQLQLDRVQAFANIALGVTRAIGEGGLLGLITGAIVTAAGLAEINVISEQINIAQGMKKGGWIRAQAGLMVNGPSHEYGGVKFQNGGYELEGGEAVINRVSARNYQGLLSQINQSGGGRPLVSSFDDSRIVDAIAKQRMEPIRAYVIEQDITRKQAINKKLDQLSRF